MKILLHKPQKTPLQTYIRMTTLNESFRFPYSLFFAMDAWEIRISNISYIIGKKRLKRKGKKTRRHLSSPKRIKTFFSCEKVTETE